MAIRYLIPLGNEVHKGLLHAWSERLQIVIELPIFAVFVLLLGPLLDAGNEIARGHVDWSFNSNRMSVLVLWFMPFTFFYMQSVKLFWRLLGEIQSGTLEQVYLSPLPSWLIIAAGRVVAALIETIAVVAATYGLVSIFVPLHFAWRAAALLPAALLIVTGVGYSLIIGGLTLVWKRIQMLQEGVLISGMIFSAAAVPLITVPGWFATVGRAFPVTSGMASLYGVMLGGRPVTTLWGMGGLVWLTGTAAVYLSVGILGFSLAERTAKRRGTLSQY